MEFLKVIKRRSFLSEAVYIGLNIGLTIVLMLIIRTTNSIWFAFALVILSQWRVFAVRPRFWLAHLQAHIVSMIVSFSFVVFLYVANLATLGEPQTIAMQIFLCFLYIIWLLFLKSQSKRAYIVIQAGVALFAGITAILNLSYNWIGSPVILFFGLIGYATAKHVLNSYDDERHTTLISVLWGLTMAELGWLAYHWTIAYRLPVLNMLIPQASIISLCFGFIAYKSYDSFYHHNKIRFYDILLPLLFSAGVITMLLIFFNGVSTGSI